MTENNVIKKLDDITNSQEERSKIKDKAFLNLMGFLNGYTERAAGKNSLHNKIDKLIMDKLDEDIETEGLAGIPYAVLFRLKEILGKNETDAAVPILKIIEAASKQPEPEQLLPNQGQQSSENRTTVEDVKGFKKILDFIEQVQKSETNDKGE